jgi:hypothetical protein
MPKPPVTTVAAVGTATGGDPSSVSHQAITAAMDEVAAKLWRAGIHDPDKIREAKLKARERVKDEAARAARRKR